jgi:Lar family restriction alleviation protein
MTAPTPPAARDAGVGELLPCPFCGGAAELIPMRSLAGDPSGHRVWCPSLPCCAAGPALDTKADAIAAWNRRAPLPPVAVSDETLYASGWAAGYAARDAHAPPAVVDAGTLAETGDLVDRLDRAIRFCCDITDDVPAAIADMRVRAYRQARAAIANALATAAQPARAVPSREAVWHALADILDTAGLAAGSPVVAPMLALLALIYGDAPADASAEDKARAVGAAGGGR